MKPSLLQKKEQTPHRNRDKFYEHTPLTDQITFCHYKLNMDPNSPNQNFPTQPQADGVQPIDNQTPVSTNSNSQTQAAAVPTDPNSPAQPGVEAQPGAGAQPGGVPAPDYVNEVGEDVIDLLDEISEDNNLLQLVAQEMQLDPTKVQSMLASVLDKIDKEQITTEDLALIMASTAADETTDNG